MDALFPVVPSADSVIYSGHLFTSGLWFPIHGRIGNARFVKTFETQPAAVALAAGPPLIVGIVTAQGQTVIEAQPSALADDFRLGPLQEGRVKPKRALAFDRRLGGNVGQPLELGQELRPAVGV